MKKIYVSDFTLKELSESGNNSLLFREKTELARCIDSFGADAVELAEVKNIKEDTIVYSTISAAVKNAAVCIPVGFTVKDVDTAWNCVKNAAKPCLQVCLPVSTVQMEFIYHLKYNKMLVKMQELCSAAKEKCDNVEFIALDATRAERDFLIQICSEAEKSGACAITLCDDTGTTMPDEFAELVKAVKNVCGIPVYVKISNALNLAVASAVKAVAAGAEGVKTAIFGNSVLKTADFADVISARGEDFGVCTGLAVTELRRDIEEILKKTGHGSFEKKESDESGYPDIYLDSSSTLSQLCECVSALGYDLSAEDNGKVYKALMRICEKKNCVGAKELEALIASNAMQVPSAYHLKSYTITSGNLVSSVSCVILTKNDEEFNGVSIGDGPIDASFRAIESIVGYHYDLDDFEIQSVTQGKESLGSAFVRLCSNGRLFAGNGISTDIVGASIRAYINALNKIVYEENR